MSILLIETSGPVGQVGLADGERRAEHHRILDGVAITELVWRVEPEALGDPSFRLALRCGGARGFGTHEAGFDHQHVAFPAAGGIPEP